MDSNNACGTGFINAIRDVFQTRLYYVTSVVIACYCAFVWFLGQSYQKEALISFFVYKDLLFYSIIIFFIFLILGRVFYVMLFKRPKQLFKAIASDFKSLMSWRRILHALPLLITFPVFFSAFTSFKTLLPEINPYQYDELFAVIDRWVHLGFDPWVILQPVLGVMVISFVIGFVYKLWFLVKFICLYWQGFAISRPVLRARFFTAYLLAWIVNGTLLAVLLSSGGPCYFEALTPEGTVNPYTGLLEYMHIVDAHWPMWNLKDQETLWNIYTGETLDLMAGISAMPSMHVSVATILLLTGWHYGRLTKLFFSVFFAFTLIGSIHLGWHYAIDGYVAIITTIVIWWLSEKIVNRFDLGKLGATDKPSPETSLQGQT